MYVALKVLNAPLCSQTRSISPLYGAEPEEYSQFLEFHLRRKSCLLQPKCHAESAVTVSVHGEAVQLYNL